MKEKRKVQRKRQGVRNRHSDVPQAAGCANQIDVFYKSSSPVARVKRELTAALDLALLQVSSNQTPGDSADILQGTASDFHVAEVRTLRRQIAHLAKLLQEERLVAEANKQDRELWYERARELFDRVMPTTSTTSQRPPELGLGNRSDKAICHIPAAGSAASAEFPDLNILLQESLSAWTHTQPVVAEKFDRAALAQTLNQSADTQRTDTETGTLSEPSHSRSIHDKRLSSTTPTQGPQVHEYTDREEPAIKRPCRNSDVPAINLSLCGQPQYHNAQTLTHDHHGEQGLPSEATASSSQQEGIKTPMGPRCGPALSSRSNIRVHSRDFALRTSQLRIQRATNTSRPRNKQLHGRKLGKNQRSQDQPWNKHTLQREISMPRPTLQRWNQSCRCSELPDYFYDRAHIKPSLSTWSWGKEEFLAHCKQIIECPGHLHITRETCREIYRTERSAFEVGAPFSLTRCIATDQIIGRVKAERTSLGIGVQLNSGPSGKWYVGQGRRESLYFRQRVPCSASGPGPTHAAHSSTLQS